MLSVPFVFLHVATMFAVIAFHTGPQILVLAAARGGHSSAVEVVATVYARTGRAVPPLGILGALFGVAAAVTGGFNLLAPWLLIAYGLFALMVVFGGVVSFPYIERLGTVIREDRPGARDLLGRRLTLIVGLDALVVVLIIADMVVKPFG